MNTPDDLIDSVARLFVGGWYVMHGIRIQRVSATGYVVRFTYDAIAEYSTARAMVDAVLTFHKRGIMPTNTRVYTNAEYEYALDRRTDVYASIRTAQRARRDRERQRDARRRKAS